MKKAFIDQMFLGFLLFTGIIVFIATVNDEKMARDKIYDIETLKTNTIKALAITYKREIQKGTVSENDAMCIAQNMATSILNAYSLGSELVGDGAVSYVWRDSDGDGRPNSVTVNIGSYTQKNFWYKLLGKDTFTLPASDQSADLDVANYEVDITFRDVINAGYYNMLGTYELDANGCPTNPELVLVDKNAHKIGDLLTRIESPKRRVFFIADGYQRFGQFSNGSNSTISLENTGIDFVYADPTTDCRDSGVYPAVQITTDDGQIERSDDPEDSTTSDWARQSRANVYFQDDQFNFDDETTHMNEIGEDKYKIFVMYVKKEDDWTQEAEDYYDSIKDSLSNNERDFLKDSHTYDELVQYADDEGIDLFSDPNDNYVYVSEDLSNYNGYDPWNTDRDFTDMSFNMKKILIPEPIDTADIINDDEIVLSCP
jgi:hypothetical protein